MRKKLNGRAGFTLVEMLAATLILIMLVLMLGTGLQMTVRSYQKITARSEVDLLLSTAIDALADDLRFARNVAEVSGANVDGKEVCSDFTYTSDSFAGTIRLELDGNGHIVANNTEPDGGRKRFLSTGVYGVEGAYKVSEMKIEYTRSKKIFTIELTVQAAADSSIEASGTVTVRCLNP